MQKIRTALLAYGMSGKIFHAPFVMLHPGFELTGAWERSKKLIQQDYPSLKSYESLEALLADDIDLVIVNTPVDTHYTYSKQALESGKHLIVEKAFTTTTKEAEALKELAEKLGLSLTVFQNRRWDGDFLTVKSVLEQDLLGEIVEVEIRFDRYNPVLSPKLWKEGLNAGAGILKDLGPHLIDQALVLFGFPQAVFADLRTVRMHSQVEDQIDLLLYYSDKRVRLHAGFFNREQLPGFVLQGRNGSFFKSRSDVQEDTLKLGQKPNLEDWGREPEEKSGILHVTENGASTRKTIPTLPGNYYWLFDGVYQAIRAGKPEPVTAQEGVNVMRVIDAAIQSSFEQRVVNF